MSKKFSLFLIIKEEEERRLMTQQVNHLEQNNQTPNHRRKIFLPLKIYLLTHSLTHQLQLQLQLQLLLNSLFNSFSHFPIFLFIHFVLLI